MSDVPQTKLKRIEADNDPFKVDVKRLYVPITLIADCPICGKEVQCDLNDNAYLSFVTANKPTKFMMYHEADEDTHEFNVPILVKITVEAP